VALVAMRERIGGSMVRDMFRVLSGSEGCDPIPRVLAEVKTDPQGSSGCLAAQLACTVPLRHTGVPWQTRPSTPLRPRTP